MKIKLGKADRQLLISALANKGSISVVGKRRQNSANKLEKLGVVKIAYVQEIMFLEILDARCVGDLLGKNALRETFLRVDYSFRTDSSYCDYVVKAFDLPSFNSNLKIGDYFYYNSRLCIVESFANDQVQYVDHLGYTKNIK